MKQFTIMYLNVTLIHNLHTYGVQTEFIAGVGNVHRAHAFPPKISWCLVVGESSTFQLWAKKWIRVA
jgi:hypothetical protein